MLYPVKINRVLFWGIFLFISTCTLLYGEMTSIKFANNKTFQCPQSDVLDIEFTVNNTPTDPYTVDFDAVFRGQENTVIKIPGFYNGGKSFFCSRLMWHDASFIK